MKKYVYLEKGDGVLVARHMMAVNRLEVKEKTGVCIDNIYSKELLDKVNSWMLDNYLGSLFFSPGFQPAIFKDKRWKYIETFVEFRRLVNNYRER